MARSSRKTVEPAAGTLTMEHLGLQYYADKLLAERRYREALPLLGRLVLGLPLGHTYRHVTRAKLARAYLALGNLEAARREAKRAHEECPTVGYRNLLESIEELAREAEP